MASARIGRSCPYRRPCGLLQDYQQSTPVTIRSFAPCQRQSIQRRTFCQSRPLHAKGRPEEAFGKRLGKAWRNTKIEWKPIPIALGVGFLGFFQFYRTRARDSVQESETDSEKPVAKRQRIYPTGGGWQVQIMSTLPLKAISRIWGRFNELDIPYYLRVPGFKLYGWIFGVKFDEIKEPDLHVFPNLAAFFYREIKPGIRPLDPNLKAILSPADGKVLSFGEIFAGEVEQVKGMTYSLDSLLGKSTTPATSPNPQSPEKIFSQPNSPAQQDTDPNSTTLRDDEEFATINGISYSLPNILSGNTKKKDRTSWLGPLTSSDASTPFKPSSESAVQEDLATQNQPWWYPFPNPGQKSKLYYCVVYLAPGDYHRFHSPVSWVCSTRRHFAGELYSVSPYVQRTLPGLFTLNERVVLLGRWKYGFFSYIPVGATNVGSIKINFDRELRTNSLTTDTQADREAAAAAERGEPYSGYSEATYEKASRLLGGHPLKRGEEMGGFQLGSSIVLVFEAPAGTRVNSLDTGGLDGGEIKGGWKWNIQNGQKVRVGEALGWVEEEE